MSNGLDFDAPEPITAARVAEWRAEAETLLMQTAEGPYSVIVALCDHILSAAPVMAEATDWQPIETAPKDGTKLLLAGTDTSGRPYQTIGRWVKTSWLWGQPDNGLYMSDPSHWQSLLPDPPALNAALAIAAGQLGEKTD